MTLPFTQGFWSTEGLSHNRAEYMGSELIRHLPLVMDEAAKAVRVPEGQVALRSQRRQSCSAPSILSPAPQYLRPLLFSVVFVLQCGSGGLWFLSCWS